MNLLKRLTQHTEAPEEESIYMNYETFAKVTRVYDGDTLWAVMPHPLNDKVLLTYKCRLWGINTPEIRTRDATEKELGLAATEYVRNMLEGKLVKVVTKGLGNFGRLLTVLYLPASENENNYECECAWKECVNVNDLILQNCEGTVVYEK